MTEKNNDKKEFDTCLETAPCAEMMRKMLEHKGIGSLCAEMMKKMREHHGAESRFVCAEIMRSMVKGFGGMNAESPGHPKEDRPVGDK